MTTRKPLPSHLSSNPFSIATARLSGVSPGQLRSTDLQRAFHGVRSIDLDLTRTAEMCLAYAAKMQPDYAFSHETAARLWGMPLPKYVRERAGLHVSAPFPSRAPQGVGVLGHQLAIGEPDIRLVRGLRVTSPALTWSLLAGRIDTGDLVAVGDFTLTGRPFDNLPPLVTIEHLMAITDRRYAARGHGERVRVLPQLRQGPLSRPESLLRLDIVWVRLPEPRINWTTAEGWMVDLAWPEFKVCVEYEGDHHRDRDKYRSDIHRIEQLVDAGWLVVKVSADDLFDRPAETVKRIANRLRSRGWVGDIDLRKIVDFRR